LEAGGKEGGSGNAEGGVKRRWGAAGWGRLGERGTGGIWNAEGGMWKAK